MSSKIVSGRVSAAWRISLWSSVAFAFGTALAFWFLQSFLAQDIQNRADSWLTGELGVLADVAQRTPENRLHDAVVGEVAELASREVPHDDTSAGAMSRAVFFLQTAADGSLKLHTGAGTGDDAIAAVRASGVRQGQPANATVRGYAVPFRMAEYTLASGNHVYLALSTSYERKVLRRLRLEFSALWCVIIALGTLIVFISARRVLNRVQAISETAALIGRTNLSSRVPEGKTADEIAGLARTLNQMLDRIELSVQELRTMSDCLAHDLRSPITSMRGKLELALIGNQPRMQEEAIISTIEELDRLSTFFSTSLDISEANADALRLRKEPINLEATLHSIAELYEPSFSQAGLRMLIRDSGQMFIHADTALLHRTLTNLFDNELKYLPPGATVIVTLRTSGDQSQLVVEDDGPGFSKELLPKLFERHIKGPESTGYGLGLAFVAAVVRSHNGSITAKNRNEGGAIITIALPADNARQPSYFNA